MFSFFVNNSYRMLCFESFVFTCLTYKNASVFGTGRSTNSMAWKLTKWAKFMLVFMNTHLLKKSRIFVNIISSWGNYNNQFASEDTLWSDLSGKYLSLTLVWNILILLFVFVGFNTVRIGPYCNMKSELLFMEH